MSYWICVSSGELANCDSLAPSGYGSRASGLQKQQVLAVGTPHRAGLHVARVVRARQRLEFARGLAVPRQNAARGVEHLAEGEVLVARVVEPVVEAADVGAGVLDRGHHVLPVCVNLRHEPEPLSRILRLERVPLDHVFAADRSFLQQWDDRVQPLVVLRTVYVQADGFAVGGKRNGSWRRSGNPRSGPGSQACRCPSAAR